MFQFFAFSLNSLPLFYYAPNSRQIWCYRTNLLFSVCLLAFIWPLLQLLSTLKPELTRSQLLAIGRADLFTTCALQYFSFLLFYPTLRIRDSYCSSSQKSRGYGVQLSIIHFGIQSPQFLLHFAFSVLVLYRTSPFQSRIERVPSTELTSHFSEATVFCHLWSLFSAGKVYTIVPRM